VLAMSALAFLFACGLLLTKAPILDITGWAGTVATYGFLAAYCTVAVATPIYLKKRNELRPEHWLVAISSFLVLSAAFVGTIYPAPPAPYCWLLYVFLAYSAGGTIYYTFARPRGSAHCRLASGNLTN
jgi:amino acid transporter